MVGIGPEVTQPVMVAGKAEIGMTRGFVTQWLTPTLNNLHSGILALMDSSGRLDMPLQWEEWVRIQA